jgi:hypothetical protein
MTRPLHPSDAAPFAERAYWVQAGWRRDAVFGRWWWAFIRIRALTVSIDWHPYQRRPRP